MNNYLKIDVGQKVAVVLTGAPEIRDTTWEGQARTKYDHPVKVISTRLDLIWSHGSERAYNELISVADVGDEVTIERKQLEDNRSCYVFHTNEPSTQAPPAPSGTSGDLPGLQNWMNRVTAWKNGIEEKVNSLIAWKVGVEAELEALSNWRKTLGETAPEPEPPDPGEMKQGYIEDNDDDIPF